MTSQNCKRRAEILDVLEDTRGSATDRARVSPHHVRYFPNFSLKTALDIFFITTTGPNAETGSTAGPGYILLFYPRIVNNFG